MGDHAYLSPSAAHRWMNCSGSLLMSEGIEDRGSSFANEGTAGHELGGGCLADGDNAADHLGEAIEVGGDSFVIDDDMAQFVQRYIDYVRECVEAYELAGAKVELRVEQRVDFSHIVGQKAFGTADAQVIAWWPEGDFSVTTVDLKYGRGVQVDADDNEQLLIYTVSLAEELSLVGDLREATQVIHQPRLGHVSSWSTGPEYLREFANRLRSAAAAVDCATTEDLNPGEKQCQWCPAKGKCPALAKFVAKTVGDEFSDMTEESVNTSVEDQPAAELGQRMRAVPLIEGWCKAIRAEVERHLLAGESVPGFKLVQGRRGARAWTNPADAEAALKAMRLKQEQIYDFKLISPATAEKLHKSGAIGPRQWPKLNGYITQSEGKPSVAPESDKRPALGNPVDDFDTIN